MLPKIKTLENLLFIFKLQNQLFKVVFFLYKLFFTFFPFNCMDVDVHHSEQVTIGTCFTFCDTVHALLFPAFLPLSKTIYKKIMFIKSNLFYSDFYQVLSRYCGFC